jgi:hypothetical protein
MLGTLTRSPFPTWNNPRKYHHDDNIYVAVSISSAHFCAEELMV